MSGSPRTKIGYNQCPPSSIGDLSVAREADAGPSVPEPHDVETRYRKAGLKTGFFSLRAMERVFCEPPVAFSAMVKTTVASASRTFHSMRWIAWTR